MEAHATRRELAQDLLPLHLAAEVMCQRLYIGDRQHDELKDVRRDFVAAAIASLIDVYEYDPERPGEVTRLNNALVNRGRFESGGRIFHYPGSQGSLTNLAVKKRAIDDVLRLMRRQDPVGQTRSLVRDAMALRAAAQVVREQAATRVQAEED